MITIDKTAANAAIAAFKNISEQIRAHIPVGSEIVHPKGRGVGKSTVTGFPENPSSIDEAYLVFVERGGEVRSRDNVPIDARVISAVVVTTPINFGDEEQDAPDETEG